MSRAMPPTDRTPVSTGKGRRDMNRVIAIRLLRSLLTIALVVTFAFVVLRLSGDPAMLIMSVDAPPEAIAAFRRSWGLDEPLWTQYLKYFGAILHGRIPYLALDRYVRLVQSISGFPFWSVLTRRGRNESLIPAHILNAGFGRVSVHLSLTRYSRYGMLNDLI